MKCHKIYIINVVKILVLASFAAGFSGERQVYEIRPHSQIVFKGSSNINQFTFRSSDISGKGTVDTLAAHLKSVNTSMDKAVNVAFQVNVKTFDSGNSRMNRDMYNALKAEKYATIKFKLDSLQFERFLSPTEAEFAVQGLLHVAGVENSISLTVTVTKLSDNLYHLQGSKQIRMTDYEIKPPKVLFGLVQARDKLTVEFDIYADRQHSKTLAVNRKATHSKAQRPADVSDKSSLNMD